MDTLTRPRFRLRVSVAGIRCGRPWTLCLGDDHLAYFDDRARAVEFCERMNGER